MAIGGGCLCGAVRFAIEAEAPLAARHCWCRVCQYIGAGAGTVNAVFRKDDVRVEGPMREFVSTADSGSTMYRRFCGECGTPLFAEAEPRPHLLVVRVGALDDPGGVKPGAIIWAKSAPEWACFDPALPRSEAQPPPPPPKA